MYISSWEKYLLHDIVAIFRLYLLKITELQENLIQTSLNLI